MKVRLEELIPIIKEYANSNGCFFSPTGTSMLPTLKEGDKVFLIKRRFKKNDIVLYKRPNGQYSMHRVIKLNDYTFIARGDNQFWTEEISFSSVIAVVDYYYHNNKKIVSDSFTFKLWIFILPFVRFVRRVAKKLNIIND